MRLRLFCFLGIQALVKTQNAWPGKSHSELEKVQVSRVKQRRVRKRKVKIT